jgi:adenylate kinase family enzyme
MLKYNMIFETPPNNVAAVVNTNCIAKRIFMVGPPGSNRKENALALAEYFNWQSISIGDLLKKEVSKKSEYGKAISESLKNYRYGNASTVYNNILI